MAAFHASQRTRSLPVNRSLAAVREEANMHFILSVLEGTLYSGFGILFGAFLTHKTCLDAKIGEAVGSKADVVLRFRFNDTDLHEVRRKLEDRSIDLDELNRKATWYKHTY